MKKGYYIHFDARRIEGVSKKIEAQIQYLAKMARCEEINICSRRRTLLGRIWGLLPFNSIPWDYEMALRRISSPDYVYMRRVTADRKYISFLKEIKKRFPNCKIIVEIPTYPYDRDEYLKWDAWPFYFKEIYFRREYKKYIDRFATLTNDTKIFGVKTIRCKNGIDVDSVTPIQLEKKQKRIDLIGVAFMQKHHGYERLICGMEKYYSSLPDIQVYLHLVGEGPEKGYYERLVHLKKLDERVFFYGKKIGQELDDLYKNKDIGVTSLGTYKVKVFWSSELKSREYLAKGLPIISGCEIDILHNKNYPYCLMFPNDGTIIDIQRIVDFYYHMVSQESLNQIVSNIRTYAKENADISIAMEPVYDYIERGE